MTRTRSKPAFTYDELDDYLRGGGHHDAVGMSAIDGLIAALVAAPAFVHPDEWLPLIFGGRPPRTRQGSAELPAVQTIFQRYNEVSTTLAETPHDYCPIFMVHADDIVVAPWAGGFILGIALRREAWATSVLLTPHRSLLVPILVHHELGGRLVPDILSAQPQPLPPDTCLQIPAAVVAVRNLCNPLRAAEAQSTAGSSRAVRSRKPGAAILLKAKAAYRSTSIQASAKNILAPSVPCSVTHIEMVLSRYFVRLIRRKQNRL